MGDRQRECFFPQSFLDHRLQLEDVCAVPSAPDSDLKMGMRKVGCWDCASLPTLHEAWRIWKDLLNSILMSSVSLGTIEGEKCANINMPLKERWLGDGEVLPTQGWSRSNSFSPLGNKVLFLFLTWPSHPCYWHRRGIDAEKTIRGHELGTSMGKMILSTSSLCGSDVKFLDVLLSTGSKMIEPEWPSRIGRSAIQSAVNSKQRWNFIQSEAKTIRKLGLQVYVLSVAESLQGLSVFFPVGASKQTESDSATILCINSRPWVLGAKHSKSQGSWENLCSICRQVLPHKHAFVSACNSFDKRETMNI